MYFEKIEKEGINEIQYEKLNGIYTEVIFNNEENDFKTVYLNKDLLKALLIKLFNQNRDYYIQEYNENIIIANENETVEAYKLFLSKLNIQLGNFEIIKLRS